MEMILIGLRIIDFGEYVSDNIGYTQHGSNCQVDLNVIQLFMLGVPPECEEDDESEEEDIGYWVDGGLDELEAD